MVLTIKVVHYKGNTPESPIEAEFDESGGSLGRSSKNHLVLADKNNYISTKHADITYENGKFYYTDTSLNGTQYTRYSPNDPRSPISLKKKDKIELHHRDELQVGDYTLVLNMIGDECDDHPEPSEPPGKKLSLTVFGFGSEGGAEPQEKKKPAKKAVHDVAPSEIPVSLETDQGMDPFFPLEDGVGSQARSDGSSEPIQSPVDLNFDDFFSQDQGPPKQKAAVKAPETKKPAATGSAPRPKKQPRKADSPRKRTPVKPVKKETGSQGKEALPDFLDIFFSAAGIHETSGFKGETHEELAHNLGKIFRELVDGLMMILRGRSELKSHLRLAMTTLKSNHNNPLKFFPTVDEVLVYALKNNQPGYIGATDAVREGFQDIMGHQLALNAGVQASLAHILKRFDPRFIAQKFEEGIVFNKKARCWDEYQKEYPQIVEKVLEDFFGEEFIRAYENQIQRLRTDSEQK